MSDQENLKLHTDISVALQGGSPKIEFRSKSLKLPLQDYNLLEPIGQGGFANVYRAVHKPTGEEVAIKIMVLDHFNPEQIKCIDLEISLQQQIVHPNIAQLYEVVRTVNKIYMIMEYCPGGQLFDKIAKNGPLPEKDAAKVFQQVLNALLHLKTLGISHRDIKPENIIFDKKGNVKLIDFGLGCRKNCDEDTFRKTFCGTPSYSPPEIILRQYYDPELMDVWGLGVTLYAMLAGQFPFSGKTKQEQRYSLLNYRWTPKFHFSKRVTRLLNSIFVEASTRINLQGLLCSGFMISYNLGSFDQHPHKKDVVPQPEIIEMAQVQCQVDDSRLIASSLKNNRLDRYHAIYFLLLKREENNCKGLQNSFLFKVKKLRYHLIKMEKVTETPVQRRKVPVNVTMLRPLKKQSGVEEIIKTRGRTIETNKFRVNTRAVTPDSPRRLLASMANSRVMKPILS